MATERRREGSPQVDKNNHSIEQKPRWRVVDTVTAAVLGVAVGVLIVAWTQVYEALGVFLDFLPGFKGVLMGVWYIGGPLGALIIRKPGAAVLVETIAAIVSMAVGSQWGLLAVASGLVQGLGAEAAFAIFRYRRFGPGVAALSGGLAAAAAILFEGGPYGYFARSLEYQAIRYSTTLVSGVVLGGLGAWLLVRALARTGALNRFAAGRDHARRV